MRVFTLILSTIAFFSTTYYSIVAFPDMSTANGILYFSMLVILLLICITGMILSIPMGNSKKNRAVNNRKQQKRNEYSLI